MQIPDLPADEAKRIEALHSLCILDTPAEVRYDRITRIAQRLFNVPIALISLVDANRQWFKSKQGLDASETAREISFCGHAILGSDIFYVKDALEDQRFSDNPVVTGEPYVRFYAGAPLNTDSDHCIGTLCLVDSIPREFTEEDKRALRDLADCVESELKRLEMTEIVEQLRSTKIHYRSVLDTVPDGIITINHLGIIQTVNPAIERMFGYLSKALIGQDVAILMPEPHRSQHGHYLKRYFSTGVSHILGVGRELEGKRKDGSCFPMALAVSRMDIADNVFFTGTIRDITVAKNAAKQLHEAVSLRQAILDAADFTIISTDVDGLIVTFNRGAQQMLGYREAEVVGKITPAVIHDIDEVVERAKQLSAELNKQVEPGFEAFVAKARLGYTDENEWTYIRKDGSRFPVLLSVTALRDQQGDINGFLGVGSDITERRKIEQMKREFISTVSHELRTPLTSIRGALGLVLGKASEGLSEKARSLLETANRNSERLTLLINDILDLEKIESGQLEFSFNKVDLVQITQQAIVANEGYGARHFIRLTFTTEIETAPIRGDEFRLMQVFANLFSNAIKYSPPESEVNVKIERDAGCVRVSVQDHGSGIPDAFRSRLFARFAQVDSTDSREKGGTGLGLSITKAIIERHEGHIDYRSTLGEGTCFYFEIPELQDQLDISASEKTPDILICEDDNDAARVLRMLLEREGLSSDIVNTGTAARDAIKSQNYSALLLDLNLPDEDGLDLLQALRESESTRSLPVIIISGRPDPGAQNRACNDEHLVEWLRKPINPVRLSRALSNALRNNVRPRILHVEDDSDIIEVTRSLLEDDIEYVFTQTFREAEQKLTQEHFDLLLLDIGLPDGNGLDLLKLKPPSCQVIIFSGVQSFNLSQDQNISAVLTKTQVTNETLLTVIKQTIHRTKERT